MVVTQLLYWTPGAYNSHSQYANGIKYNNNMSVRHKNCLLEVYKLCSITKQSPHTLPAYETLHNILKSSTLPQQAFFLTKTLTEF
jgi:hypothetical protein